MFLEFLALVLKFSNILGAIFDRSLNSLDDITLVALRLATRDCLFKLLKNVQKRYKPSGRAMEVRIQSTVGVVVLHQRLRDLDSQRYHTHRGSRDGEWVSHRVVGADVDIRRPLCRLLIPFEQNDGSGYLKLMVHREKGCNQVQKTRLTSFEHSA